MKAVLARVDMTTTLPSWGVLFSACADWGSCACHTLCWGCRAPCDRDPASRSHILGQLPHPQLRADVADTHWGSWATYQDEEGGRENVWDQGSSWAEAGGGGALPAGGRSQGWEGGALWKRAGWLAALGMAVGAAPSSCALERRAVSSWRVLCWSRRRAQGVGSLCSPQWSREDKRAQEGLAVRASAWSQWRAGTCF